MRQRRRGVRDGVRDLRVVRHAAPRSRVHQRFSARRPVAEDTVVTAVEATAARFGEEHRPVDERETEARHQDRLTRRHELRVEVRRVPGADVDRPPSDGVLGQCSLPSRRVILEVAERQDDAIRIDVGAVGQVHGEPPGVARRQVRGRRPVHVNPHLVRRGLGQRFEHGGEIARVHRSGGECRRRSGEKPIELRSHRGVGPQRLGLGGQPVGQGRPARAVGVHRDVGGGRVHPQQSRLILPPDPSATGWKGIDDVDVDRVARPGSVGGPSGVGVCSGVGGYGQCDDALEDAGTAWSAADEGDDHGHVAAVKPAARRVSCALHRNGSGTSLRTRGITSAANWRTMSFRCSTSRL
ncbi:hypothetical protein RhoFasK5_02721|nr:hypothetical protein [Rhodococcus kroppenstedtii]